MPVEKMRYRGMTVSVHQSASGTWHAQSGSGYGSGPTREAALKDMMVMVRKQRGADEARDRAESERIAAHRARTQECAVCSVRVGNMAQHAKTAKHRNAERYATYRQNEGRRF